MKDSLYELIVQSLRDSKPEKSRPYDDIYHSMLVQWNLTCENFAYYLSGNYAGFNRNEFLRAVGYG